MRRMYAWLGLSLLSVGGARVLAESADPRFQTSGVLRRGDELVLVSDEIPGAYLTYKIADIKWQKGCAVLRPEKLQTVRLETGGQDRRATGPALDLEGITDLGGNRLVVLSERLRALVDAGGLVVQYDDPLGEIANAGVEGVAARPLGDDRFEIAVLWEGGYLEPDRLPPTLRQREHAQAVDPFIVVHEVTTRDVPLDYKSRQAKTARILAVPRPPGDPPAAQRFRAPDLVWSRLSQGDGPDSWGFIILLNSRAAESRRGSPKDEARRSLLRLQQYYRDGTPVGPPVDIDERVPPRFRHLNWEGLTWWDEGKTLIVVDDAGALRTRSQPPVVCLVEGPRPPERARATKGKAEKPPDSGLDRTLSGVRPQTAPRPADSNIDVPPAPPQPAPSGDGPVTGLVATATATPVPDLMSNWIEAVLQRRGTEAEARAVAEKERARVSQLRDPFSPLANVKCVDPARKGEVIVWEDDDALAIVDRDNKRKILIVPKIKANFPFDLPRPMLAHLAKVAAATCDALLGSATTAGGIGSTASCDISVHPPAQLSVRQLHVHVLPKTAGERRQGDYRRVTHQLQQRLGGSGCP